MAIDAIGGTFGSGAGLTGTQQNGVNQEQFVRLFLTQLSFQDPLKPADNREFLAQLAQFTNVEQTRILNDNIEGLLSVMSISQSLDLLGKSVEVTTDSGRQVGTVTTATLANGSPRLVVQLADGTSLQDVSPTRITLVRNGT